jgi:F-type H+-transporting ATPase subunit epsilon
MSTIHLDVVTPEREVFSGDVAMLLAPGIEGQLGILPHHAALLTGLTEGELVIRRDGEEDLILAVAGGFLEVGPEKVIVLADVAERADDIDLERAEAARKRAEELLQNRGDRLEVEKAQAALRRAATRIRVATKRRRRTGPGEPSGPGSRYPS